MHLLPCQRHPEEPARDGECDTASILPYCLLPGAHVGHNALVPQDSLGSLGQIMWDEPGHHGLVWARWQGKMRWCCSTCLCNHHGKTVCERLSSPSHAIPHALRWAHAMPVVGNSPELRAELLGKCGLQLRCGAHS